MTISFENLPRDYDQLQVPVFILKGYSDKKQDCLLEVSFDSQGKDPESAPFFPVQYFQVTKGYFKAMIYLNKGANPLQLKMMPGSFPEKSKCPSISSFPTSSQYDSTTININYVPYTNPSVPKIHLCLLLGKDSPGEFDCPSYKKATEGNNLDVAIQKLKMGGRIMQAFTQDEMFKNGLGNRCFRFVEEQALCTESEAASKNQFYRDDEIKIHVIRTDKTVKEIRSHDMAQQNPHAKDSGGLFSLAIDTLVKYGGPDFANQTTSKVPAMAACMYLDGHWDGKFITGHAALGGGNDRIKLAIFGSHGLHSWPMNIDSLHNAFTDTTQLSTREVANDCNQCSSSWECLTVTLGAFMHEIGHSLGCPHQENGVMLRDYITMNRKFISFENYCIRTKKSKWGPVLTKDEPGWHRLDILRFLYHPAFQLPRDLQDETLLPQPLRKNQGMKITGDQITTTPQYVGIDQDSLDIHADLGVYAIEVYVQGEEFPKMHYEYLPASYRGMGPQKTIKLSLRLLQSQLDSKYAGRKIKLQSLAVGFGQATIDDVGKFLKEQTNDHALKLQDGRTIPVRFSSNYGERSDGRDVTAVVYDKQLSKIRVTHGGALDGVEFFCTDGTYQYIGNPKHHYSDFVLDKNEFVVGVNVRSGGWVDAIQFVLNSGRVSPMYGNVNGGSLHKFSVPSGMKFVGLDGKLGGWMNRVRVIYSRQ